MDSEEEDKILHKGFDQQIAAETDNRLHAFWESYKGGIKGKLGGFVIGAVIGAALGIPAAFMLASSIPALGFAGIIAAFSGAGMLYAAHDFDQVGKISGGVAAGLQVTEGRLKKYMGKELSQIKEDLHELKQQAGIPDRPKAPEQKETYRKDHLLVRHKGKPFYWKLAAIGLVIGAVVGAMLATGPLAAEAITAVGLHITEPSAIMATSTAVMALFGASFGINRDIFRGIFDKTDKWFKGISPTTENQEPAKAVEPELAAAPAHAAHKGKENPDVATAVLYSDNGHEKSGTYFRDNVLASRSGINMLLGFDPSGTRPH